jgi:hypothetical protein
MMTLETTRFGGTSPILPAVQGAKANLGGGAERLAARRGRKPASESRAAEFRDRLAVFKRTPEGSRLSLRAVARELGTSHQLLSHYLQGWGKWEGREYKRLALQIRAHARAERRDVTPSEEAQARTYDKAAFQAFVTSAVDSELSKMLKQVRAGVVLSKHEIRFVNLLARKGFPMAHKITRALSQENNAKERLNNLPGAPPAVAKSFKSEFGHVATPLKRSPTLSREITVKIIDFGSES